MKKFSKRGQVANGAGAMVTLVLGVGIALLLMIFVGALGGQVYQTVEADITAITNDTIKGHILGAITESFSALEKTGSYMPLLVLATVIGVVLFIVLGFTRFSGGGGNVL
jgi:hypothetical protein